MQMTFEDARQMAAISVFEMSKPVQVEFSINDEETVELPDGWLFFYNTKAFLDSGDPVMALAGNGPIDRKSVV